MTTPQAQAFVFLSGLDGMRCIRCIPGSQTKPGYILLYDRLGTRSGQDYPHYTCSIQTGFSRALML